MKFTATWRLESVKTIRRQAILLGGNAPTFQTDSAIISKLIWLEFDQNLRNAYVEKRALDG
jgi:hypothetical protein